MVVTPFGLEYLWSYNILLWNVWSIRCTSCTKAGRGPGSGTSIYIAAPHPDTFSLWKDVRLLLSAAELIFSCSMAMNHKITCYVAVNMCANSQVVKFFISYISKFLLKSKSTPINYFKFIYVFHLHPKFCKIIEPFWSLSVNTNLTQAKPVVQRSSLFVNSKDSDWKLHKFLTSSDTIFTSLCKMSWHT